MKKILILLLLTLNAHAMLRRASNAKDNQPNMAPKLGEISTMTMDELKAFVLHNTSMYDDKCRENTRILQNITMRQQELIDKQQEAIGVHMAQLDEHRAQLDRHQTTITRVQRRTRWGIIGCCVVSAVAIVVAVVAFFFRRK